MIDALNTFLAVTKAGSFSAAARKSDLAVSSVTRQIDGLETELGAKLFNRSSRALTLTDAGEQLLPRARQILAELAEAKDAVASLSAEPRGVLIITAPSAFGERHVVPAVAGFLSRYPRLEIDLHVSDAVIDLVQQRVDVAVCIGVLPNSDLLATRLAPQRRVACASPEYLKRCGAPERPEDLLNHNCLTLRSTPSRVGWWSFAGVNNGKPLAVHGSLRSDEIDALLHAALCGMGIAHLATWMVVEEIAAGQLVALFQQELLTPAANASAIHTVRMPGRSPVKSKLFVEHLRTSFGVQEGGVPYWDRAAGRDPR